MAGSSAVNSSAPLGCRRAGRSQVRTYGEASRAAETSRPSRSQRRLRVTPSDLASMAPTGRMVSTCPTDLAPVVEAGRHHDIASAVQTGRRNAGARAHRDMRPGAHVRAAYAGAGAHVRSRIGPDIDLCRSGSRGEHHGRTTASAVASNLCFIGYLHSVDCARHRAHDLPERKFDSNGFCSREPL